MSISPPPSDSPQQARRQPTPDELIAGIRRALEAHDMEAVAALITRLALVEPQTAEVIVDAVKILGRRDG